MFFKFPHYLKSTEYSLINCHFQIGIEINHITHIFITHLNSSNIKKKKSIIAIDLNTWSDLFLRLNHCMGDIVYQYLSLQFNSLLICWKV